MFNTIEILRNLPRSQAGLVLPFCHTLGQTIMVTTHDISPGDVVIGAFYPTDDCAVNLTRRRFEAGLVPTSSTLQFTCTFSNRIANWQIYWVRCMNTFAYIVPKAIFFAPKCNSQGGSQHL